MASINGIEIEADNTEEVIKALKGAYQRGLEAIGQQAEGYAKGLVPVDTGRLRASITHKTINNDEYIGTNVDYAPYVEFGTGEYAENGGRKGGWFYVDDNGVGHFTRGRKPKPFLRPAAKDHASEYRKILEDELKGG